MHETSVGSGREFVTVLGAGLASGVRLPPYTFCTRPKTLVQRRSRRCTLWSLLQWIDGTCELPFLVPEDVGACCVPSTLQGCCSPLR